MHPETSSVTLDQYFFENLVRSRSAFSRNRRTPKPINSEDILYVECMGLRAGITRA